MIQITFPLTGPSSVGAVKVYTSEHLPCGGPELVNTNVYGQLIAWQELMSSSKQPYGEETMVIPIYGWSPALDKDSNVPENTLRSGQLGDSPVPPASRGGL